jgi:ribonuclease M5
LFEGRRHPKRPLILFKKVDYSLIKEIIVVEGLHDSQKLQSIYPGLDCIITNGSEITESTIELIRQGNETRGVILFLDPDFPGKKITQRILENVPGVQIAFLNKKDAISRNHKKVGVEHASETNIKNALDHLFQTTNNRVNPITRQELFDLQLINHEMARKNRQTVCERLHLPFCNGKTFLKLINRMDINLSRIVEVRP